MKSDGRQGRTAVGIARAESQPMGVEAISRSGQLPRKLRGSQWRHVWGMRWSPRVNRRWHRPCRMLRAEDAGVRVSRRSLWKDAIVPVS